MTLRLIAGQWRGRKLQTPEGLTTRPTAEKTRAAIFNVLQHAPWAKPVTDKIILDLCCGSGALGLEALSRGAQQAFFIDNDRAALFCLKENITKLVANATTLCADAAALPKAPLPCDIIFFDPPYQAGLYDTALGQLQQQGWLAHNSLLVVEHQRAPKPNIPSQFKQLAIYDYGKSSISYLTPSKEAF